MLASTRRSAAAVERYRDAYRVANTIVGIGTTIKVIGFLLGGMIFLVSLLGGAALGGQSGGAAFASVLTGAIAAGVVGLLFWLAGVLVSSQGQVLFATLDAAVSHSPFLTDDERAAAMSLPDATVLSKPSDAATVVSTPVTESSGPTPTVQRRPNTQPGERTITCPQCGVVNPASLFYCENCKRNLHM